MISSSNDITIIRNYYGAVEYSWQDKTTISPLSSNGIYMTFCKHTFHYCNTNCILCNEGYEGDSNPCFNREKNYYVDNYVDSKNQKRMS